MTRERLQLGEPWYGHKFKEVTRGVWRCECGKQIIEGEKSCMNGSGNTSTLHGATVSEVTTKTHCGSSVGQEAQENYM